MRVIFDLDGTIANINHRTHFVRGKPPRAHSGQHQHTVASRRQPGFAWRAMGSITTTIHHYHHHEEIPMKRTFNDGTFNDGTRNNRTNETRRHEPRPTANDNHPAALCEDVISAEQAEAQGITRQQIIDVAKYHESLARRGNMPKQRFVIAQQLRNVAEQLWDGANVATSGDIVVLRNAARWNHEAARRNRRGSARHSAQAIALERVAIDLEKAPEWRAAA